MAPRKKMSAIGRMPEAPNDIFLHVIYSTIWRFRCSGESALYYGWGSSIDCFAHWTVLRDDLTI